MECKVKEFHSFVPKEVSRENINKYHGKVSFFRSGKAARKERLSKAVDN